MGEVVALHGPTIQALVAEVVEASGRDALAELLVVGRDGYGKIVVGGSQMTEERALWLADHLMQWVRSL